MRPLPLLSAFLIVSFSPNGVVVLSQTAQSELCVSETKIFTAQVNLYAGELGSFYFEECGIDNINPHIAMEIGETYTFIQKDRTNYYHPLGFAYSPFGDEELKLEVQPGTSKGDQSCIANLTCAAPMYFLNDNYLGQYSNLPEVKEVTTGEGDYGLGGYQPLFYRSVHEWTKYGTFSVQLKIDDDQIENDLFYFCRVHEFMGGRIKLTKDGKALNELDRPSLGYERDVISPFDEECGTYGLGDFELPNPLCPSRFVCTEEDQSASVKDFSRCVDAMNCHMMSGMTTGTRAESEPALFIHQMIPHHQNAVNMAKALIKTGSLKCDDLSQGSDPDCLLEGILLDIVNNQNYQIQLMYDYLDAKRLPEKDNCDVYVETLREVLETSIGGGTVTQPPPSSVGSGGVASTVGFGKSSAGVLFGMALGFTILF